MSFIIDQSTKEQDSPMGRLTASFQSVSEVSVSPKQARNVAPYQDEPCN
jgi:hypothetical protein